MRLDWEQREDYRGLFSGRWTGCWEAAVFGTSVRAVVTCREGEEDWAWFFAHWPTRPDDGTDDSPGGRAPSRGAAILALEAVLPGEAEMRQLIATRDEERIARDRQWEREWTEQN